MIQHCGPFESTSPKLFCFCSMWFQKHIMDFTLCCFCLVLVFGLSFGIGIRKSFPCLQHLPLPFAAFISLSFPSQYIAGVYVSSFSHHTCDNQLAATKTKRPSGGITVKKQHCLDRVARTSRGEHHQQNLGHCLGCNNSNGLCRTANAGNG